MRPKKSIETFDTMCDLLEDRLNVLGEIRTDDAWKLCNAHFGYSTITSMFKKIMELMIEGKKAYKIRNGLYVITKPNIKPKAPELAAFALDTTPVRLERIEKFINK